MPKDEQKPGGTDDGAARQGLRPDGLAIAQKAAARTPAVNVPADPPVAGLPGDMISSKAGVAWPGLPSSGRHLIALAVQFQLEQSQWWSPERIAEHQYHQLGLLIRHSAQTVPYYRDLFRRVGFDAAKTVTPETWRRIPTLSRRALKQHFQTLQSNAVPEDHGAVRSFDTSGSTGAPVFVHKTELQRFFWLTNTLRDHLWHKRDLSATMASIRIFDNPAEAAYPQGVSSSRWGESSAMFATGPGHSLNLETKVHLQVEWLRRIRPAYLLTHPSNLAALARYCLDHRISMPFLRGLRTMSETLRPEVRDLCRETWGVEIVDLYSTEEVGVIAIQSPVADELLVQAETILVEVIDEQGQPCPPGRVGRLVVTPLHAFALPLLRYEIGDLAEAGGRAACGRGLPVLARLLGRERNMVRLPNGHRHYPSYHYFMTGFDQVMQFQIVRKTVQLLEVRLVVRSALSPDQENELRARVHERFDYPFDVQFVYLDEIPRAPSGKYLDYYSELKEDA